MAKLTMFGNRVRLADMSVQALREQIIAIVDEMADRLPESHADRALLESMVPQLRASDDYLRENAKVIIDAAKAGGVIPRDWYGS